MAEETNVSGEEQNESVEQSTDSAAAESAATDANGATDGSDAADGNDSASADDAAEATSSIDQELVLFQDLQRLQAEFVNYKARVERDRDQARLNAIAEVIRALLPAMDDLYRAEAHGDLAGSPFEAVATKLRTAGEKFGLVQFGAEGDTFDPEFHDALLQTPSPSVTQTAVSNVIEPGYRMGDRLIRAAKVAVFIPAEPNQQEAE